jgi:pimeloyl-ACP methyl ester carboxylesterase
MQTAHVNGVELSYEVTGDGFPLVFSHEFAGDYRSWESQVNFFSRRYQVITYNHRGYPPSEVPTDPGAYSQDILVEDLRQLLHHLKISKAHIAGLSMGGNITLHMGLKHPELCASLVVAGCGTGSANPKKCEQDFKTTADRLYKEGMQAVTDTYTQGPTRVQFRRKDPRGWGKFRGQMAEHSALGCSLIVRGVQLRRPSIFALEDQLKALLVPTLLLIGDEDEPCLEPAVFMKRRIPCSGLVTFAQSGHTVNLEEPDLFNRTVLDFLTMVEAGKWAKRDLTPVTGADPLPS